jgi:hypothetical protein
MPVKETSPSSQPTVTNIHLDYEDGSSDDIRLLQGGVNPVYDLCRKRPGADMRSLGAHTGGAIAGILVCTVTATERVEYSLRDPKIRAVLEQLFGPRSQA